jgi:hypothetical protein
VRNLTTIAMAPKPPKANTASFPARIAPPRPLFLMLAGRPPSQSRAGARAEVHVTQRFGWGVRRR